VGVWGFRVFSHTRCMQEGPVFDEAVEAFADVFAEFAAFDPAHFLEALVLGLGHAELVARGFVSPWPTRFDSFSCLHSLLRAVTMPNADSGISPRKKCPQCKIVSALQTWRLEVVGKVRFRGGNKMG